MTDKQILRYLELVERKLYIVLHSGVDWKQEYAQEMRRIDEEIEWLRPLVEQERRRWEYAGDELRGGDHEAPQDKTI